MGTKNTALIDAQCDATVDLFDGGTIELYDVSDNLLASVTIQTPAFDAAGASGGNAAGVAVLEGVPLATTGLAAAGAGTDVSYAKLVSATPFTYEYDALTVGVGSGEVQLSNLSVAENQDIEVTAFSIQIPAATP